MWRAPSSSTVQWRHVFKPAVQTLVSGALGVLAAAALVALDASLEIASPVTVDNARSMLGSLVSAVLTLAVFALWMRSVVTGLLAGELTPRVVTGFLDDEFQRHLLVALAPGVAFVATVLLILPTTPPAPVISIAAALLITLLGLVAVLMALSQGVRALSLPLVIRGLADRALGVLESDGTPDARFDDDSPLRDARAERVVRCDRLGWVRDVDHDAILSTLPSHATMALHVDVGSFVAYGDVLGIADVDVSDDAGTAVRAAIAVGRSRSWDNDLAFSLQQLGDVARHAMGSQTADSSTAQEALLHLTVILERLLYHGLATGHAQDDEGRTIISIARWSVQDHLREVLDPIISASRDHPIAAYHVQILLSDLRVAARTIRDQSSEQLFDHKLEHLRNGEGLAIHDGGVSSVPQRPRPDRRAPGVPRSDDGADDGADDDTT